MTLETMLFVQSKVLASHTTAATVSDTISRLPREREQGSDAASERNTKTKEDSLNSLRLSEADCPMLWIRLSLSRRPKSWDYIEGPDVPMESNLYGHLLAGLLGERKHETRLGKCLYLSRMQGLFLSVNVDHRRWLVSKMTCSTCGRNLGKCRFGRPNATDLLIKCAGDALSVKQSPMTELWWRSSAYSQDPSSPVRRSR